MSRLFREEESLASLSYPRSEYYLMSGYTPGGPYGAEPTTQEKADKAQADFAKELAKLSPEDKAKLLAGEKKGTDWSWLTGLGGGLASVFTGIYAIRTSERQNQQQMELNTYAQARQGIIQANTASKLAEIEAEKSRYTPVYIAAGLAGLTIVALVIKQMGDRN